MLAQFLKQSAKPEIVPLIVIVGGALGGAGYIGLKQAKAPDVAWYEDIAFIMTQPY